MLLILLPYNSANTLPVNGTDVAIEQDSLLYIKTDTTVRASVLDTGTV